MRRHFVRSLVGLGVLGATACGLFNEPDWQIVPGLVDAGGHPYLPQVITAPDTVTAGESFAATITTYGSTTCTHAAGAQVTLQPLLAVVVPLDSAPTSKGTLCTQDVGTNPRSVDLLFTGTGEAIIRVVGHGDHTVERKVVVIP